MAPTRLAIIFVSAAAAYAGQAGSIDVQDIIRKSVAATAANWKEAPKYSFVERDLSSKKNRAKTTKTYEVLMIEGSPYEKLLAVNDHPLSASEQQAENQKLQNEINNRQHESPRDRKRRIGKYERERLQDQAMMREMGDAFNFRFIGETKIDGRDAYQFAATPKPGYVPKTRETKVLLGMKGTLWVDKDSYQWAKVEAEVVKPVSFYGIAKVAPGTRFELEQKPLTANLWMPTHFAVRVNASALGFLNENSTDDETYRDYRPMSKALELQARR